MALFSFLNRSKSSQRKSKSFNLKNLSTLKEWIRGLDIASGSRSSKISEGCEYERSVWVYRCINVWQSLAAVPLKLYQRKDDADDIEVKTGNVKFLLDNPNSKQPPKQFFELIISNLGLWGQAFILKEDGKCYDKLPQFLQIINPNRVRLEHDDVDDFDNVKTWTVLGRNGRQIKIDPRGVIHIKLPNPYDPKIGLSPVQALRASIDSDYAARLHNAYMMENHGRISGIVSFKNPNIDEKQLKAYAKIFNESFGGPENTGKTAFLNNEAEYQAINQTMKDMDWLQGMKISREEICAGYNVPPIIAGDFDKGTYSNYEEASKQVWTSCLIPLGSRITDVFQKEIVDKFQKPSAVLEFDVLSNVEALREDFSEKIAQYKDLVATFFSPKVAAETVGLRLGDIKPEQEIIWTTFNMVPASISAEPPEAPAPVVEPPKTETQKDVKSSDAETREMLRSLKWKSLMSERRPHENAMERTLKSFFYKQRTAFLQNFDAWFAKQKSATPAVTKAWDYDEVAAAIVGDINEWNDSLITATGPILEDAIATGAKNILEDLGKSPSDYKRLLMSNFKEQQKLILVKVNETTKARISDSAKVLEAAIRAGKTPDEAAEEMRDAIRSTMNATEARRRVIARTEIGRSMEAARNEQMRIYGVASKEWLSSRDSEVRDSHSHVDGEVIANDDVFSNGLEFPLDPAGPPGETINCRCTLIPVVG